MEEIKKIGIQGIKGSFHHQVAIEYFKHAIDLDECLSFDVLVDNLVSRISTQAIMAIENSIAGSILAFILILPFSKDFLRFLENSSIKGAFSLFF